MAPGDTTLDAPPVVSVLTALAARYRIDGVLGTGGMGTVYRAFDTELSRPVALKTLRRVEEAYIERFRREGRAMARLSHPGIVTVYDADVNQAPYLVMELVDGRPLSGPIPVPVAVRCLIAVLEALAYAHARDVVHRDLKPANVLLARSGAAKLTDFGIARLIGDASATLPGTVIGTPGYMSPEQARGLPTDHRTDLYSAGVMLFELVAGRLPFGDAAPAAVMRMHVESPPPQLRAVCATAPEWLDAIVAHALEKDPDRRFPNASTFAEELRAVRPRPTSRAISTPPPTSTAPALPAASPPQRGRPALVAAGLLALGLVVRLALSRSEPPGEAARRPVPSVAVAAMASPSPPSLADVARAVRAGISQRIERNMVPLRAGRFSMGSREERVDFRSFVDTSEQPIDTAEQPVHEVSLQAFAMARFEVTQEEFEVLAGFNPSRFRDPAHPVESVTWHACQRFIDVLNRSTSGGFRLPTEAEWEYACRAESLGRFSFGDDQTRLSGYGWYLRSAEDTTHPVGRLDPNAFGLYDMHGNVSEWCEDVFTGYQPGSAPDPAGRRVHRGGSWRAMDVNCRSAARAHDPPDWPYDWRGFRLARTLTAAR